MDDNPASRLSSSSLDHLETNGPTVETGLIFQYDPPRDDFRIEPITPLEASFRHSSWCRDRARVFTAFSNVGTSATRKDRFANCGSCCKVVASKAEGRVWLSANYCHDRFCLPCATARSRLIARQLAEACKGKEIRFITLTLKHSLNPLREQVQRLYRSFHAMRRRPTWKAACKGGAAFLEVKVGRDNKWHPHLHILAEGTFLDQKDLSREWLFITGDSYVVDIRRPRNENELIGYVCKYASKPLEHKVIALPERLEESIIALRGIRLCTTFGTWRGIVLEPEHEKPSDAVVLGTLASLLRDAAAGDSFAQSLLNQLRNPETIETQKGPDP